MTDVHRRLKQADWEKNNIFKSQIAKVASKRKRSGCVEQQEGRREKVRAHTPRTMGVSVAPDSATAPIDPACMFNRTLVI